MYIYICIYLYIYIVGPDKYHLQDDKISLTFFDPIANSDFHKKMFSRVPLIRSRWHLSGDF